MCFVLFVGVVCLVGFLFSGLAFVVVVSCSVGFLFLVLWVWVVLCLLFAASGFVCFAALVFFFLCFGFGLCFACCSLPLALFALLPVWPFISSCSKKKKKN